MNLLAVLLGILAFLGISRIMLPPAFWLSAVLSALLFCRPDAESVAGHRADRSAVLLLHDLRNTWLYCLDSLSTNSYSRHYAGNGDFAAGFSGSITPGTIHSESFLPGF